MAANEAHAAQMLIYNTQCLFLNAQWMETLEPWSLAKIRKMEIACFVTPYDTPADDVTVHVKVPTFQVLNQFSSSSNALTSSKLGSGTRTSTVPCQWESPSLSLRQQQQQQRIILRNCFWVDVLLQHFDAIVIWPVGGFSVICFNQVDAIHSF